jgi:transcriptional regulator with XRE-family HTH domain
VTNLTRARTIAAIVRARRKELDLTHRALATRVGCTEATIQKIEAGLVSSPRNPDRLADGLGITLEELYGRKKKNDVA